MTKFRLFIGDKSQRWYVEYYDASGFRKRVYDGVGYGLEKGGNQIKSVTERREYFKKLFKLVQSLPGISSVNNQKITLSDAFKIAITAKEKKLKSRSVKILKVTANYLINAVGNLPLHDVSSTVIITYLDSLSIKAQSVNSIRRDLHTLFAYLLEIGLVSQNPVTAAKNRKVLSTDKNEAYTSDELKLVLSACQEYSPNLYLISVLMYAAFLRPSEIIQMAGDCLDFENNRIVLPNHIRKTNDHFIVPMTAQLKNDLMEYEKHKVKDSELVFKNQHGKMLSEGYYSMSFLRVKKRYLSEWIGKHQTLNSIRHTAAINYFQKTQNLKKLSTLMGHTSIQTTIIYLRSLGKIVGDVSESDLLEY